MNDVHRSPVVVCGGGLVGSLLSIYLKRRGHGVALYERMPDMRVGSGGGGRSINLVVASRGIAALERLGLTEKVLELTVPVHGRMMHAIDGTLTYQPYGRDESECNYSVSRAELNMFLLDEAEREGVATRFERPLVDADLDAGRLVFDAGDAGNETVTAERVFGADGANSAVRAAMRGRPGFTDSMDLIDFGYKELTIPAAADGGYVIEKNALHIWPRGNIMLMALPNLGGSFTVTLYLPYEGAEGFDAIDDAAKVRALFERHFPDAIPLIPDLDTAYFENPTGVLGTVRCGPWNVGGRAALIGDAAHAIVPFFGQGMNCGFEDCRVLDELMEARGDGDWDALLDEYGALRKPNADAIADMALDNFVEMRDRVGDERFLLAKAVEHRLEEELPTTYRSRYSMVMYGSHIPYRLAQEAGERQRALLDDLCRGIASAEELDIEGAARRIGSELTPFLEENGISLDY